MLHQLSRIKSTKHKNSMLLKSNQLQHSLNQIEQGIHINPIVKHTYDCLPKIYGSNTKRKKKYNILLKNRNQFLTSNNSHNNQNKEVINKHQCWNTKLIEDQILSKSRSRGVSAFMEYQKKKNIEEKLHSHDCSNGNLTEDNRQTVMKNTQKLQKPQKLHLQISTQLNLLQLKNKCIQTPKNRRNFNLQSMQQLSKPRDKCSNRYCSCKAFYQEYQTQIQKKNRQNNATPTSKGNSGLKLPKIRKEKLKTQSILEDRQSRHRVSSGFKINSMLQNQQCEGQDSKQCYLCNEKRMQKQKLEKGLLGAIKKKQIQVITKESNEEKLKNKSKNTVCQHQDHATQANLNLFLPNKSNKVDQQVNTDFQDTSRLLQSGFKYLQNKGRQNSSPDNLSKMKQKYKQSKRPLYQSKYPLNQKQDQEDHCNDQSDSTCKHKKTMNKKRTNKNKPTDQKQQFDLNASNSSIMSQNFLMQNIARAISSGNQLDKNTIFSLLKKKQIQSESQSKSQSNSRISHVKSIRDQNRSKTKGQFTNQKGLFTIPQEDQYVQYLRNYKPIMKDFKVKDLMKSENFRILKFKDTVYFGEISKDQMKNGKAIVISPKEIFQGVYENGIKMSGCERNIDGVYVGQFLNGKRHGKGKFLWNNGQVFEGQWKLGTKNGHGTWKSPKGDYYQGDWLLNRQHGKGIYRHRNSTYEGQFKNFLKNGHGKQKFINGDIYEGQYKDGKPHGKGKYTWKNHVYYEGQFVKGLRQGFGIWHTGQNVYEGQFKKDFKHGKGKQIYKNGDNYQGEFNQGIKTNGIYKQLITGKQIKIKNNEYQKQNQQDQEVKNNSNTFLLKDFEIQLNQHSNQKKSKQQQNIKSKSKNKQMKQIKQSRISIRQQQ